MSCVELEAGSAIFSKVTVGDAGVGIVCDGQVIEGVTGRIASNAGDAGEAGAED